ncbi:MAG TPA: PfkB family carbohydrate kinase [Thermoplasmata archaeon]|nr:PfkB family carbohydrate kinase [Thermoplasmata archaeon]
MRAAGSGAGVGRLDLVVSGHTNLDRIVRVERLPERDRTVPARADQVQLGGTAANIARVAGRAGVKVGLVSRVGADFPAEMIAQLRKDHVDTRAVTRVDGRLSSLCYIFEDPRGGQMTVFRQGPMDDAEDVPIDPAWLDGAPWLHLTTGDPAFQLRFSEEARRRGIHVAVDPAQEVHYRWDAARLGQLLEGAEILFGNRAELERVRSLLRVRTLLGLTNRVPLVVMTDGPKGARAVSRRGTVAVAAARVAIAERVTGAGDAFRGGFYSAYLRGAPLDATLREAVESAARWIATRGGGGRAKPWRARSR